MSLDEVRAELRKRDQAMLLEDGVLMVILNRSITPEMELIGQLKPM